jgi:hypothetical protein
MRDDSHMLDRLSRRACERLGARYTVVFLAAQVPAAALIACSRSWGCSPSTTTRRVSQVVLLGAITAALTSRGSIFLRGTSDPIKLLAPVGQRSAAAKAPDAAVRI